MIQFFKYFICFVLMFDVVVTCTAQTPASSGSHIFTKNHNQWLMIAGEMSSHKKAQWAGYMEENLRVANLGSAWQQWIPKSDGIYREHNHVIQLTWKFIIHTNSIHSYYEHK